MQRNSELNYLDSCCALPACFARNIFETKFSKSGRGEGESSHKKSSNCVRNNRDLYRTTESVRIGADATVYISGFWARFVNKKQTYTVASEYLFGFWARYVNKKQTYTFALEYLFGFWARYVNKKQTFIYRCIGIYLWFLGQIYVNKSQT